MGNTLKNFEKKRRKQQKDDYTKKLRLVHSAITSKCPIPREVKEKEAEVFNMVTRDF